MRHEYRRLWRRLLRVPAEIAVAIYVVLDGIVAPLFGPFMRFLSSLGLIRRMERVIACLPPYLILALLVVPFIVAEFAKAYGILLLVEDRIASGLAVLAAAYIVSILVCQRIFLAGRDQLMQIGWFKAAFDRTMAIKDRVLARLQRTRIWHLAEEMRERVEASIARMRLRWQPVLRPRSKRPMEQP